MINVHIIFGSQGAGKSTYSINLAKEVTGVHLSIDEWMWSLFGDDLPKTMDINWIMPRVRRCEKMIWEMAKKIIDEGGSVILDLGFMKEENRQQFLKKAESCNYSTQLHYVDAPESVRHSRVMKRNTEKGKTFSFEVTSDMFKYMETQFEPLTPIELETAIRYDSNQDY